MHSATILRHAAWKYPVDELSEQGVRDAQSRGLLLGQFDRVFASEYHRARQTARHLTGSNGYGVMPPANELVYSESFPTPEEYTRFVFATHANEAEARTQGFLKAIRGETGEGSVLIVSHRVLMIALFALVTRGKVEAGAWNCADFQNLEGMRIGIEDGKAVSLELLQLRDGHPVVLAVDL